MLANSRVAAYGDAKRFIHHVHPNDIVFFSHKWTGIVAAAKVRNTAVKAPNDQTLCRDVEFLTPVPKRGDELKGMPFKKVSAITGKSFYWARTIKVPYLSRGGGPASHRVESIPSSDFIGGASDIPLDCPLLSCCSWDPRSSGTQTKPVSNVSEEHIIHASRSRGGPATNQFLGGRQTFQFVHCDWLSSPR